MSKYLKPKTVAAKEVEEVDVDQVENRGQLGRTILTSGTKKSVNTAGKKSILGG